MIELGNAPQQPGESDGHYIARLKGQRQRLRFKGGLALALGIAIGGMLTDAIWLMVPRCERTMWICPEGAECFEANPDDLIPTPRRDHGQRRDARGAWGASQGKQAVDHVVPLKGDAAC